MSSNIVPSKLYRVKIFESVEWFKFEDGGKKRWAESSDPPLETQINEWVDETKCLIVGLGPVTMTKDKMTALMPEDLYDSANVDVEHRSIALTYVTPVEQGAEIYGEEKTQSVGNVGGDAQPEGTTSAPAVSDGGLAT